MTIGAHLRRRPAASTNIGYGGDDCAIISCHSYGSDQDIIVSSVHERSSNLPSGAGRSTASIWRTDRGSASSFVWSDYRRLSRTLSDSVSSSVRTLERAPLKYLAAISVLSWLAAYSCSSNTYGTIRELKHRVDLQRRSVDESRQSFQSLQRDLKDEKQFVRNLEMTQEALSHEVRIIEELEDAEFDVQPEPPFEQGRELIQLWLDHRQEGLEKRVMQLQRYVQDSSRVEAIERYGEGPYFVRFTVEMPIVDASANRSGGVGVDAAGAEETTPLTDTRSFLAELAPLAAMPHSVFFFLELVRLGVWDDTVFFHHENVEHILTAIPMDFLTGDPKPRLDSIGAKTLSFPEYSADYPHEKYTLGFPNMGPNFYINTRSNVEMHGPGGQGHHILPLDADPCFGRVIEGKDAVDDLIRLGQWEGNSAQIREVNGVDPGAQFVTRIISIDIVRSSSQIAD